MSTADEPATPHSAVPAQPPTTASGSLLVWLDMEMSGLDPDLCVPLEIATLVTTPELEIVAEGPNLIMHQPDAALARMDAWNTKHHGESGLTDAVRSSRIGVEQAEAETLAFLARYVEPGKSPLCGNTIGQDRRFLVRYMPRLEAFFHYRNIDISTIKELARRWYGATPPAKKGSHRALDDILESVAELRWYRAMVFREVLASAAPEPPPEGTR